MSSNQNTHQYMNQSTDKTSNGPSSYVKNSNANFMDALNDLFSQSNMSFVLVFLAIYFVLYFGLGIFFNKSENPTGAQIMLSRSIDIIIIGFFLFFLISYFISLSTYDKDHLFVYCLEWTKEFWNNPQTIIELAISIIVFYILVYLCGVPMTADTRPWTIAIIENKLWILLVMQIFLDFFKYVFGIHIIDILFGDSLIQWWNNIPESTTADASGNITATNTHHDASGNATATNTHHDASGNSQINEVFNIANNLYTYDDAQAICTAYDASLATYDQVEDSYNNGGEWCNYGWSAGQMALFPTQKNTWDTLQKTDNHKNDCGRPGINGGVIANPYVQFGVNCYGKKPKPTNAELAQMSANTNPSYPPTVEAKVIDAKVKYWKDHAASMLNINSFNKKRWTEY